MTFVEMREQYDKYNAFQNYLTVKQAKVMKIIPEDFAEYLPDYCECGSENIITTDLTIVECCNPRCPVKQAFGLASLFSRFSCKGIGEAICKRTFDYVYNKNKVLVEKGEEPLLQTNSYVEILMLPESVYSFDYLNSADGHSFLHYCKCLKERELTFPEMVGNLGLPELGTTAYSLFDGINNFDELRNTIMQEGGIAAFCDNRNYFDPMKKFWLYVSLQDIYVASCFFENIRSMGLVTQQVCITGSLNMQGHRVTKKDFLVACNHLGVAKSYSSILKQLLIEKGVDWFDSYKEGVLSVALNYGISSLPDSYEKVLEMLETYNDCGHPLIEVQMTQAKESVPYIIADSPSNSAKYQAGLRRGVETNADGSKRKVLISSEEYLNIIKELVRKWELKVQDSMQQKIQETSQQNSSSTMMTYF